MSAKTGGIKGGPGGSLSHEYDAAKKRKRQQGVKNPCMQNEGNFLHDIKRFLFPAQIVPPRENHKNPISSFPPFPRNARSLSLSHTQKKSLSYPIQLQLQEPPKNYNANQAPFFFLLPQNELVVVMKDEIHQFLKGLALLLC